MNWNIDGFTLQEVDLPDPMPEQGFYILWQRFENVLGYGGDIGLIEARFVNHLNPIDGAGHEGVEVKPPWCVTDSQTQTRRLSLIGRGRVP